MKNTAALSRLVQMSKYAGERFDLVQAGGGNTSVKFEDKMYIKASGYLLSEVSDTKGYTLVKTKSVLSIMENLEILEQEDKKEKDELASQKLQDAILEKGARPSIETYLHALLYKYTFHVHAIAINIFTSHKNWEEKMKIIDKDALLVRYETPGIALALALKKGVEHYQIEYGFLPKIIFLQNHGIIISSEKYEDIEYLTETVVKKAEQLAGLDFSRYRTTSIISKCYNSIFKQNHIAYLSEDAIIYDVLKKENSDTLKKPFSPDGYVFCGHTILRIDVITQEVFANYQKTYSSSPKILLFNKYIYILAADLKKAKMIEDVFKNNLLIANTVGADLQFLEDNEISYLGNWEAEKYRQKL